MGQQIQDSQIANYRRRMQRDAPAAQMKTLFEKNEVVLRTYTVTVAEGVNIELDDNVHAVMHGDSSDGFAVTDCVGRNIGAIRGESGRVLAEELQKNELTVVKLSIKSLVPITGDARVQIILE